MSKTTKTKTNQTILVNGEPREVLNTGSVGTGCAPHTYELAGCYVYETAGVWWMQLPGRAVYKVTVEVPEPFKPTEVAYLTPGKGWKKKVCKTQKALDKFLESLDSDVQCEFRTYEGV